MGIVGVVVTAAIGSCNCIPFPKNPVAPEKVGALTNLLNIPVVPEMELINPVEPEKVLKYPVVP